MRNMRHRREAVLDGSEGIRSGNECFVTEDNNHWKRLWCNDQPLLLVDRKIDKALNWEFRCTQCLVRGVCGGCS